MKARILLAASALLLANKADALFGLGDVVHDPILNGNLIAMNSSQLAQWAEAIKRYEDQILNQLENIQRLKDLGDINNIISARIGDWKGVYDRARSIQLQSENLTNGWGISYNNAVYIDSGSPALVYTANDAYVELDVRTHNGQPSVAVREQGLRRYVAVENLYETLNSSLDRTATVRENILKEISETSEELAKAPDHATTAKLNAKLDGLRVALANVQAQREEIMHRMMVQHTLNENQRQKEIDVQAALDAENAAQSFNALGSTSIGGDAF